MKVDVAMPNLGYDMDQGTVARWFKAVGDRVERGEPLAEIETDKAAMDMEALVTGTLVEIVSGPGSEVAVGVTIAYIETEA